MIYNIPKNIKKHPRMAISYKCEGCGARVENKVPKYKGKKRLCERCFFLKKSGKSTKPKHALQKHYLRWAGVIR